MLEGSFILLRQLGSIDLAPGEQVRFSIDAYRGFRYVSVRRYIETDGFSGATRDGITLTPEIVRALAARLATLPDDPQQVVPGTLGKFAKRPGVCVVARVGDFKGKRGLDLRQWQEETGWTKKGIWLPMAHWHELKELFRVARAAVEEAPVDDF